MLSALLKYAKKVLVIILMASLLVTGMGFKNNSCADYSENMTRKVDVVIRAGEWANANNAKPGKRYTWGNDINISDHGLTAKDIPTDIPLRKENDSFYISEADINLKTARMLARKLHERGIDVDLQFSTDSNTDLNSAGRIAALKEPKIYLSIHHNSYTENSNGYFFMTNENDKISSRMAQRLSDSIKSNNQVRQLSNRLNENNYIGELNKVASQGRVSMLAELGFFSNPYELKIIMSDAYVNYITTKMADELCNILIDVDKETMNIYMADNNKACNEIKIEDKESEQDIETVTQQTSKPTLVEEKVEDTKVVTVKFVEEKPDEKITKPVTNETEDIVVVRIGID